MYRLFASIGRYAGYSLTMTKLILLGEVRASGFRLQGNLIKFILFFILSYFIIIIYLF